MREALVEVARGIDHVASMAVLRLDAEPTIDIQVSVADLKDLESFRRRSNYSGYTFHERRLEEVEHRFDIRLFSVWSRFGCSRGPARSANA